MRYYVLKNQEMRMNSKNANENRLFNLLNKALFHRSILSKGRFVTILDLLILKINAKQLISKHYFNHADIIDEQLITASVSKDTILLGSAYNVGVCILDIATCLILKAH